MVILIAKQQSIVPLLRSLTAAIITVVVHVYKYSIRFRSLNHCQWSCCFAFLSSKMQSQCFGFMPRFYTFVCFSTLLYSIRVTISRSTAPSRVYSTAPIFHRLYSNSKRQHCIFEMLTASVYLFVHFCWNIKTIKINNCYLDL